MLIPLFNATHWYADLYVSPAFWTLGLMFDRTECGCVWSVEVHVPFFVFQLGYVRDGDWDDEAVWEPAPQEDCEGCGFENVQNGECAICGWNRNGQR